MTQSIIEIPRLSWLLTLSSFWSAVKRLATRYDPSNKRSDAEWAEAEARWKRRGISVRIVRNEIARGTKLRIMQEDFFEALMTRTSRGPVLERLRRLKKVDRRVQRFIEKLRKSKSTPPGLPGALEKARYDFWEEYVVLEDPQLQLPRHRPSELWFQQSVRRLAEVFKPLGKRPLPIARAIHEAFVLAGHADFVTLEKVRHVIRSRK
jgi:hypothetical protein